MTVKTRKFSQFVAQDVDDVVGLTDGANSIGPNGGGGGSGGVTQVIIQNNDFEPKLWIRFDEGSAMYVRAIATTTENAEVIGVVIAATPTQFTVQQSGYITSAMAVFTGLIAGEPYFLSDVSLGLMDNVDVLIDGEVSRPVFVPDTSTSGWVLPYRGIIAGGGPDTGGGSSPSTDSNIVTVTQDAHGLLPGDWVRVTTPLVGPPAQVHYVKADASTLERSQSVGVVIEEISADAFKLQFSGYVSGAGPIFAPYQDEAHALLTPATVYYLSSTPDSGQLVDIDPGTLGFISKPLYISEQTLTTVDTNAGYILPQRPLEQEQFDNPITKTITQAGHGFTMIGAIVKPSTIDAGEYVNAVATSLTPSFGTAMIVDIPDINTIVLQEVGYVEGLDVAPSVPMGSANSATPFDIGVPYYLDILDGQISSTEPVSPNFSKPMFMPDQTGAGWILPMKPTIGHGGSGGGAGMVFLQSTTVNAAAFALLEGNFSSTYNDYMIVIDNLHGSGVTYLAAQVGFGLGPTYITAGVYQSRADSVDYTGGGARAFPTTTRFCLNSAVGADVNRVGAGTYTLYNTNLDLGATWVQITGLFSGDIGLANAGGRCFGGCDMGAANPVTGIRFFANAGTISGRFSLYGLSH